MPIHNRHDKSGYYFIYGNHGKKYYYDPKSPISLNVAYTKALNQLRAAHVNK